MRSGDEVLRIDGKSIDRWSDVNIIRDSPGRPLRFEVQRSGERLFVEMVPVAIEEGGKPIGELEFQLMMQAFHEATYW